MILDYKHLALFAGAVLLAGIGLHYYEASVRADAVTQAVQKVHDEDNKQSQQQIKAVQDQAAKDKADLAAQISTLGKTVATLKTPSDKLDWVIAHLPNQPGQPPITINVPKDQTQPATITVPQSRVPEVTDAVKGCDECKLNLASATNQLTYAQQQQQLLASQLVNVTKDRDSWKTAAKGGSWIRRAVRAGKYLLIGGAVGYVAAKH